MRRFHRIRPPTVGDYTTFILLGFLFGLVAAVSFVLYQEFDSPYAAAVSVACSIGLLLTYVQKRAYDYHVWLSATPIEIDEPEPQTVTQTQYAQQTNTPAGQVLTYSNITLPDSDWLKIAGLLIRNGTISRDDMVRLDLMSLSEKVLKGKRGNGLTGYEDFITKATAAGWVKLEKGQRVLTDSGRVHFMSILYPPTPSANPEPSVAHEATTDGDDD